MKLFRTVVLNRRMVWPGVLYLLIVAGALSHIFYIAAHNPVDHIWSDPERHWVQGIDAQRNDPMAMTDPVMYQLYIGALAKLTFKSKGLVAFYTILLSLLTPWLWYRFLRELQPSKTVALTGALIFIWLPSWLSIYAYFMQETLMLPLLGLALWMTWRCKRKQTLNSFLVMVLVWALVGLTRGICIPLAAVACTWLWLAQPGKPLKAVYSIILLSLILVPLSIRSYQQMGIWAPYGVGQMNVIYAKSGMKELKITYRRHGAVWNFGFGSPSTGIEPFAPLSHWKTERTGKVFVYVDIDKGYEDWKTNLEYNKLTLSKYLWITKENLIFLFFGESWPDSNRGYVLGNVNYWMRWIWAPLTVAIVVLTALFRRRLKGQWLLPSIILAWFVVQGLLPLALNEGRYRKPFEGLIIAQAVLLLGAYVQWRKNAAMSQPDHSGSTEASVVPENSVENRLDQAALSDTGAVPSESAPVENRRPDDHLDRIPDRSETE